MDLGKYPKKKQDYILEQEEGEIIVFHPSSARSFYLNESASVIWEMCDGDRRVSDIIAELSSAYPEQASELEKDVVETIQLFIDQEVIEISWAYNVKQSIFFNEYIQY